MTDEQIELLRFAIQREIEYLSIDGFEHGAWGGAEQVADEKWKEFQESFNPMEIDGIKKEQALATLDDCSDHLDGAHENILRRALDALPQ